MIHPANILDTCTKIPFIIIYHEWWMDKGCSYEEVVMKETRAEAEEYAKAQCYSRQKDFNYCDYHVVEATITIRATMKSRKLTLLERITGRVD